MFLAAISICAAVYAQDPLEIVRKSVSHDQTNWERARNYVYTSRTVLTERTSSGQSKTSQDETHETMMLYGEHYRRLIARDGKPLPQAEALKEQQKIDRLAEKRHRETEAERKKRIETFERDRRKQRDMAIEIPEAYNFKLVGQETIRGRNAWIIDADPKPGYQPKNSRGEYLKKFKGRMWIDQAEYQWVKLSGETIDTVSWGLFLARLYKGSTISFEQIRVNDEVWMPLYVKVAMDARIALLKHLQGNLDLTYSDFRKFQADSRIVATEPSR